MYRSPTQSEAILHSAYETGSVLVREGVGMFISICAFAVAALLVEIAYLFTGVRKQITAQHVMSGGISG